VEHIRQDRRQGRVTLSFVAATLIDRVANSPDEELLYSDGPYPPPPPDYSIPTALPSLVPRLHLQGERVW